MSYIYNCWITVLLPSYQDGIVAGLAAKGYMVGPADKDGKFSLSQDSSPSTIIALRLYREKETNEAKIYDDVVVVLQEMKAYHYSVVVALAHGSIWGGPNFELPSKKGATPPPLPPAKKHMN